MLIGHHKHPDHIADFLASSRSMSLEGIGTDIVHDPFLMPDIEKAVRRILQARER